MQPALLVLRALFFTASVGTAVYVANVVGDDDHSLNYILVAMALASVIILTEVFFSKSNIQLVSAVIFGTIVGALAGWMFTGVIQVLAEGLRGDIRPNELNAIRLVLSLVFVYFGITLILQTKDDFRFIVPFVEFRREVRGERPFVVDTSALIDGRWNELAQTGLLDSPVIVPRFVVDELQALADSQDKGKRARGRRGLDMLTALRDLEAVRVEVLELEPGDQPVDRRLVALCVERQGRLVTTDQALEKLCQLERVPALNLHALARGLQQRAQAGEKLSLKIHKAGEEQGQGVGYLDDGAMVVVDGGKDHIGKEITVEVTSALRTRSGQMYFAKIAT